MKYNKKYLLDLWVENHTSNEEDYYNCPECDYALDYIQDEEGINYVFCWNYCLDVFSHKLPHSHLFVSSG
jgi:hypothetical protein